MPACPRGRRRVALGGLLVLAVLALPALAVAASPQSPAPRPARGIRGLRLVHLCAGWALLLAIAGSLVLLMAADAFGFAIYFAPFYLLAILIAVAHLVTGRMLRRRPVGGLIASLLVSLPYAFALWLGQAISGFSDSLRLGARIALLAPLAIVVWTLVVWRRMARTAMAGGKD